MRSPWPATGPRPLTAWPASVSIWCSWTCRCRSWTALTATRAIREHTGGLFDPDIPVLGLSAYAIKGDRERFMAAGMDDYLAKPIRFEDFFRAIRRLLRARLASGAGRIGL